MDPLTKALALAAQDVHVFPVRHANDMNGKIKTPLLTNGFKGATTDSQLIREWWNTWPNALVGYWTGASNLVVLDLDEKFENSGELLLESLELDYASAVSYRTPSGGSHQVFRAPTHRTIRPSVNFNGLKAVDVRASESYAIWYGDVPNLAEKLRETPEWLLQRSKKTPQARIVSHEPTRRTMYDGDIDLWIEWLSNDTPWFDAKAIEAVVDAKNHIGHDDLLKLVYRIHMTRLEGGTGLAPIFIKLVDKFRATTNNVDGWQRELEDIVRGAIGNTWTPCDSVTTSQEGAK